MYCIFPYTKGAQKKKTNVKSEKCIFICYSDVTKGYKLYNLEIGKLIVNRDVQFLENKRRKWTQTQNEEKRVVLEENFVEDNENQKDSITNKSISNTHSPIRSSPM